MSTSNMAASWRQANDVIAPGWAQTHVMEVSQGSGVCAALCIRLTLR